MIVNPISVNYINVVVVSFSGLLFQIGATRCRLLVDLHCVAAVITMQVLGRVAGARLLRGLGFREAERMRQRMTSQITVASELLAAISTVVGLDIRVREKVRLQVGALIEATIANVAFVRRVLHVEDAMHRQSATLTKAFPTLCALERLLFRVDVPVRCKMNRAKEESENEYRNQSAKKESESLFYRQVRS